jgi:hypothetical protein
VSPSHLRMHLPGSHGGDAMALVPDLCTTKSQADIAAAHGLTRRQVETRWARVRDSLCLHELPVSVQRLALLRLMEGADECWCRSL